MRQFPDAAIPHTTSLLPPLFIQLEFGVKQDVSIPSSDATLHYNNRLHKLDINILKQYARNRLLSYFYLFQRLGKMRASSQIDV